MKQVGEASGTSGNDERQLKQQDSEPKEPDAEPQKALSEFEKLVIKALKEKEKANISSNTLEDLDSITDALKKFNTNKVKAIKIKKVGNQEKKLRTS